MKMNHLIMLFLGLPILLVAAYVVFAMSNGVL